MLIAEVVSRFTRIRFKLEEKSQFIIPQNLTETQKFRGNR